MGCRGWCGFFTEEEFDAFGEAVDGALSAFGAQEQDLDDGTVRLAAGDPVVEVYEFPLETVAARCRDVPRADWETVCFGVIHRWVDGTSQREWLRTSTFPEMAPRLRVWISGKPPKTFESDLADPAQPFSEMLHDAYCVSFWVRAPALGGIPSIPVFLPNETVAAWNVTADELLYAAQDRLRGLPTPLWDTTTVNLMDEGDEIEAAVDLHYLVGEPDSDPLPTAWALILNDVAPQPVVQGTLLAMPAQQLLLLSYPRPDLDVPQRLRALAHHADHAWNTVDPQAQLSPWDYHCDADGVWRTLQPDNVTQ